jgi:hypothetical protein
MNDLSTIGAHVLKATSPEEIFGKILEGDLEDRLDKLKRVFRSLLVHPDQYPANSPEWKQATAVFQRLTAMRTQAETLLTKKLYGRPVKVMLKGRYERYAGFATGDIADLHAIRDTIRTAGGLLLKVAHSPKDTDLIDREANTLRELHEGFQRKRSVWKACIPALLDTFTIAIDAERRKANVIECFEGFRDAVAIRSALPAGVDGRTLVWMWKRLIMLLDWTHKLGYLHGAVLPPHVLYYPDNDGGTGRDVRKHSVRLVDWCYSVEWRTPGKHSPQLKAWLPRYAAFYPPEVAKKKDVGPWTDLYMGAKTMLFLAGGDPATNKFPDMPKPLALALQRCLHKNIALRPAEARRYFDEFNDAAKASYGAPVYHKFVIPT